MTTATQGTGGAAEAAPTPRSQFDPYDQWMESVGIPIYRDYFLDDLRTQKLGRWRSASAMRRFWLLRGNRA